MSDDGTASATRRSSVHSGCHDFGDGEVRFTGLEIGRVRDGKIVERREIPDDQEFVDRKFSEWMERMAAGRR